MLLKRCLNDDVFTHALWCCRYTRKARCQPSLAEWRRESISLPRAPRYSFPFWNHLTHPLRSQDRICQQQSLNHGVVQWHVNVLPAFQVLLQGLLGLSVACVAGAVQIQTQPGKGFWNGGGWNWHHSHVPGPLLSSSSWVHSLFE